MEIDDYFNSVINKQMLEYIIESSINVVDACGELKNRCNFMYKFTFDQIYRNIFDYTVDVISNIRAITHAIINGDAKGFVNSVHELKTNIKHMDTYVKEHLPANDRYTNILINRLFDSATNFIRVLNPYYIDIQARYRDTISEILRLDAKRNK